MASKKRPKSSLIGLGDFALSMHNVRKTSQINSKIDSMSNELIARSDATLSALQTIGELQVATMSGLITIHDELDELSQSSWKILERLNESERREEILGDLKLFLIHVEEEVTKIRGLFSKYPEYSTLMAENLNKLIIEKNVSLNQFKRMPTNDIKWAKNVIDSVPKLYKTLLIELGGP